VTPTRPTGARISPDKAYAAIGQWRRRAIDDAYHNHFNGLADAPEPFSSADLSWSALVHALQEHRYDDIADLDVRLTSALQEQGLPIAPAHPAVPRLRPAFATAWHDVERHTARFRRDDFSGWPEDDDETEVPAPVTSAPKPPLRLDDLVEQYVASQRPKDEPQLRGYVRRLKEHLGDPDVSTIDPPTLDRFLVELRKFPNTKRPAVNAMSFDEVIEAFGADRQMPKLTAKTVWKWFSAYHRVFAYAARLGLIERNPVEGARPKLRAEDRGERLAYSADDVAAIFSKPLFTGAVVRRKQTGEPWGYRDEPGTETVQDAYYWLPLFALWHGCRLEEIGAAATQDVKSSDGIWYLDLTGRKLKTRQSQRQLPLHPRIVELGFLDYVQLQTAAAQPFLFPRVAARSSGREIIDATFHQVVGAMV
jgi:integrase